MVKFMLTEEDYIVLRDAPGPRPRNVANILSSALLVTRTSSGTTTTRRWIGCDKEDADAFFRWLVAMDEGFYDLGELERAVVFQRSIDLVGRAIARESGEE